MSNFIEWGALAQVVVIGIIVGAGLPLAFAVGVRSIAGRNARGEDGHVPRRRKVLAACSFGVVVLATLGAVAYIAAGGH